MAGITKLIECHGSFQFAKCTKCQYRVNGEIIRKNIFKEPSPIIPLCFRCNEKINESQLSTSTFIESTESFTADKGILKPEIVFFGEELPDEFHDFIENDRKKCDLLIVIGSSLKVC